MAGSADERSHPRVVVVGASGGKGLLDMVELLSLLPASFPGTVLLTLHRPADQPSNLAYVLQRLSALPVLVARPLQPLQAGACYVGQPAAHLALCSPNAVGLVADARHAYRNRTIDLLFRSAAVHAADHAVGVILSGFLADGSYGLASIMQAGGIGMASAPWQHCEGDMPRNAIAFAGPLHHVGRVPALAQDILDRVRRPLSAIAKGRSAPP